MMNRTEWLEFGIRQGYCSAPVCSTHDGIPTSAGEDSQWEDGEDPCVHIIRPFVDEDERLVVEDNFSPAQWRKAEWLIENGADDGTK